MMNEYVTKDLAEEQQSDFHVQMLKDSKALVDMSRRAMSKYYDEWDRNDEIYRGKRLQIDKDDKAARERKEPEKMVVPVSYSQVQTFVAFCFSLFFQRERFFELYGMSIDDHKPAKIGEALLQRDLSYNVFEDKLYQFLLDIARFGVGIIKTCWVHEQQKVRETVQKPGFSFLGFQIGGGTTVVEKMSTKFMGNRITNISPYRFFPDTRLPLKRFQEGEFVASEDEFSFVSLKKMEADGLVSGVDYIKTMTKKTVEERGTSRFSADVMASDQITSVGDGQTKGTVLVTEVQRVLIPSQYIVNGKPLGPETVPTKYVVWYANDNRVIKCEPAGYIHDEFTYDLSQFSPDQHKQLNEGLSDMIDSLQSVLTWFINSHITSVRKVIGDRLVVDPAGVEMQDVTDRKPIIRLKAAAGQRGIDRWIKQLDVNDVTARHVEDAKYLHEWVQTTTGISENLLGQFHGGRRSAQEARQVFGGGANRLKMSATLIFRTGLEPMGRKMLSNLRDGLDVDAIVKVVGLDKTMEGAQTFLGVSKDDLVGNYDFEVFDGTLPSEKTQLATTLENTLMAMLKAPQAAVALGLDPKAIWRETMELRGVRNPQRFELPAPINPATGQPQLLQLPQDGSQGGMPGGPEQPPEAAGGDFGAIIGE